MLASWVQCQRVACCSGIAAVAAALVPVLVMKWRLGSLRANLVSCLVSFALLSQTLHIAALVRAWRVAFPAVWLRHYASYAWVRKLNATGVAASAPTLWLILNVAFC